MKPYEGSTTSKKEQVRTMFDRIAPNYDRLNHIMSLGIDRRWRRRTVKELKRSMPATILDLATGTGDLALLIASRIPGATVTGADLSPQMLGLAGRKAQREGMQDRVRFEVAEAESLPYPDGMFDAVTVAFGVRNFDDIHAGLAESYRVLDNGGHLYILEFSKPRNRIFGKFYDLYFHRFIPWVGGVVSGERKAYAYLPRSVEEFPEPELFARHVTGAGFVSCSYKLFFNGIAVLYHGVK